MTVAPSHTTMKNTYPRYRPLSQPLSNSLYCEPPESNLFYAPCSVFFCFFVQGMFPIFFVFFPLCKVQKVKSASSHVVLPPWRSGPVGTFDNPLAVSSNPPAYFFIILKKENDHSGVESGIQALPIRVPPLLAHDTAEVPRRP